MVQSNKNAAKILSTYGCSACTDITGFGLMGHLLEMIKCDDDREEEDTEETGKNYNKIAVELSLKTIPMLLGAVDCIRDGIFSSLHPQNIRCSRAVGNIKIGES
jgi:selenide,water dikinase